MLKTVGRQLAAHQLAAQFMLELRDEIGLEKFIEACTLNVMFNTGICASHDFCDANKVMALAWENSFSNEDEHVEFDIQDEDERKLWGEAWRLATEAMAEIGKANLQ